MNFFFESVHTSTCFFNQHFQKYASITGFQIKKSVSKNHAFSFKLNKSYPSPQKLHRTEIESPSQSQNNFTLSYQSQKLFSTRLQHDKENSGSAVSCCPLPGTREKCPKSAIFKFHIVFISRPARLEKSSLSLGLLAQQLSGDSRAVIRATRGGSRRCRPHLITTTTAAESLPPRPTLLALTLGPLILGVIVAADS